MALKNSKNAESKVENKSEVKVSDAAVADTSGSENVTAEEVAPEKDDSIVVGGDEKEDYPVSVQKTEKEPAKRIKIKRSLVIFPFCRLLIVFCYIQLVYKLLRSGIIFKDSRYYRNHGSGSSVQSDGPPTGSFYSVIYYSCSIFILLILFKSDFFSDPGLS